MSTQSPYAEVAGDASAFGTPRPALAATLTDAVPEQERIQAIDVARGVAILGIFMVNMQIFAGPFGVMMHPGPPEGSGWADTLAYYFVLIFCAGKFYPLFSTLFGIGFMIQLERAQRAGRSFVPAYIRRLLFLCILGLIHGLLLWYGDILFIYSFAGTLLFGTVMIFGPGLPRAGGQPEGALNSESITAPTLNDVGPVPYASAPPPRALSARALIWTGIVLILISAAASTAVSMLLGGPPPSDSAQVDGYTADQIRATTAPAQDLSPSERLFAGFRDGTVKEGPVDPLWMETETAAYRDGPWIETFIFRAMSFGMMIVFTILTGFGLHVLGMFFIGAGLLRGEVFSRERLGVHRRFIVLGLLVGLPIVLLGMFLPELTDNVRLKTLMGTLNMLGGPLMSLAYLGAATLIAASGILRPAVAAVARVGRMALSNYLTETVVATFLMYHWGLGWFGSVSPSQQVLIVICVYAGLLVTSTIWLRFFRFGPMEWLWRSFTYLRPQPLVRRAGAGEAS